MEATYEFRIMDSLECAKITRVGQSNDRLSVRQTGYVSKWVNERQSKYLETGRMSAFAQIPSHRQVALPSNDLVVVVVVVVGGGGGGGGNIVINPSSPSDITSRSDGRAHGHPAVEQLNESESFELIPLW